MQFVYGPIPSRRLGQSLGIDAIPFKTCNWNCVYCQLGRTTPLTNERKDFFPVDQIAAEVRQALKTHRAGEIDWVTFVGAGEPALHAGLGRLIRQVKGMTSLPVAVITNGSLLYLPGVRRELAAADAVLPSLDAGNAELYRRLNRPHPEVTFERLVEGLIRFREIYAGKLWIEVMLVGGINDTPQALGEIAAILRQIGPDAVHLNLPTRSPVEPWVRPPSEESLQQAVEIMGSIAQVVHPPRGSFGIGKNENPLEAVLAIITRHPMRQEELEQTLSHWPREEVRQVLEELKAGKRAQIVERGGIQFWSAAPARYPPEVRHR